MADIRKIGLGGRSTSIVSVTLFSVLVAGCVGPFAPQQPAAKPEPKGPPAVSITTAPVQLGDIGALLSYSGNVQSRASVNVVPKIQGRLEQLYADIGDELEVGEVLGELDHAQLDAQVTQAEAAVTVAQARLSATQAGAKAEDITAAEAGVRSAQARLEQVRSGARPEEVAAQRAVLNAAANRLEQVRSGAKDDDLASLQAAVDQARSAVEAVRAQHAAARAVQEEALYRFNQAQQGLGGPGTRPEDIAQAQAQLDNAKQRLEQLRNTPRPEDLRAAQLDVERNRSLLEAAEDALDACGNITTTTRSNSTNRSTTNNSTGSSSQTTRSSNETRSRQSCPDAERERLQNVANAADITVQAAINQLEKTRNGPTIQELAQQEAVIREREAALTKLKFGGTTDLATLELRVGQAKSEVDRLGALVDSAQTNVDATQARVDAARFPSEFDVRGAEEALAREQAALSRLVNVSPFDVRASLAQLEQTQAQLDARRRPFTAEDILIAASQVDQASAALEAAKVQQGESLVRAPFKGVVAQKFVSPGAIVAPNTPVVQLVSKEVEIVLQVEEARIGQLRAGQPAQVSVAAFPGQPVSAQVASVAPTADPRSRTFAVRILPNDPDGKLRDGMFAQVNVTAPPRATLLVPSQAIATRSGRTVVFVLNENQVRLREVSTGVSDGQRIEIVQGLTGDAVVATSGLDVLNDGSPVQVRNSNTSAGASPES
ncbi:MAG: efflux RND transporter periplasmic adaptor subunit [Chloroflexota bacterium]